MKWVPHQYQERALKFVLENPAAGLLLDPGLGKSSVMLAALKVLKMQALVIAPLRVIYDVWPAEATKWHEFGGFHMEVLHGKHKESRAKEDADIFLINPEGLPWLFEQAWYRKRGIPEVLVVDESTRFKHHRTQRFKLLKNHLHRFDRRYILTGTPAPNGLLDLYGQIYILDLGATLGRSLTQYRNKWFYQTGFGGFTWMPRPGAEEEIYDALRPYVMRLAAEDYLEMPDLITTDIVTKLPGKALKIYNQLVNDLVVKLQEGVLTASNSGVLTMKLRQVSNGIAYVDGDKESQIHTAKADALEELIDELQGNPLLVAYTFTSEARYLADRFDAPVLGGGTSAAAASRLVSQWNDGSLPVLLVHPASAGHGLNLQEGGRHIAWFGGTWDLEHYDQTIRRLWRQGQEKPVHVYHLIASEIDRKIFAVLRGKTRRQNAMFEALKEELHRA